MRALAFALVSALLAAAAGYGIGRLRLRRTGLGGAACLALATLWAVLTAHEAPGMEGLARFILALILLGPATLGFAGGLWWGLRRG